jgi:hypothetical protein
MYPLLRVVFLALFTNGTNSIVKQWSGGSRICLSPDVYYFCKLKKRNIMNIWLHSISHCAEVSYPLLEKGYLSIGWSDFSTPEFVRQSCEKNGGTYFDDTIQSGHLPRNRYALWYFITEMEKGDWVIVPRDGSFSIVEIGDDKALSIPEIINIVKIKDWFGNSVEIGNNGYLYNTGIKDDKGDNSLIDIGFFKQVKPVATEISRYEYADAALTARMKIRQSTAKISDLREC